MESEIMAKLDYFRNADAKNIFLNNNKNALMLLFEEI